MKRETLTKEEGWKDTVCNVEEKNGAAKKQMVEENVGLEDTEKIKKILDIVDPAIIHTHCIRSTYFLSKIKSTLFRVLYKSFNLLDSVVLCIHH